MDSIPALEQFIEPAPVQFTPDAPGWYVLGIIVILIVLLVLFLIYMNYRKNRYRKIALDWLNKEEKRFIDNQDYTRLVYTANMLAKRISIQVYGREKTASLHDSEWIDYLNKSCSSGSFTPTDEEIIRSVYDGNTKPDNRQATDFTAKIKHWIKKHHSRL